MGSRVGTWRAPGRAQLAARRVALGLSQRQVAGALTRLGQVTAARTVAHWELGTTSPREERLPALALVLEVEEWRLEGWLWPGLAVPSARLQRAVAMVDARELAAAEAGGVGHGR